MNFILCFPAHFNDISGFPWIKYTPSFWQHVWSAFISLMIASADLMNSQPEYYIMTLGAHYGEVPHDSHYWSLQTTVTHTTLSTIHSYRDIARFVIVLQVPFMTIVGLPNSTYLISITNYPYAGTFHPDN